MVDFFTSGPNASRKFIDLIWRSSTKWAVWDPTSHSVEVGDYGTVNGKTGRFERQGNIFHTESLAGFVAKYKERIAVKKEEEVINIASHNGRQVELDSGFALNVNKNAKVEFKTRWKFAGGTGALLVAWKPRSTTLPPELNVAQLAEQPALQKMFLVTNVTTCPKYALYMAAKAVSGISLALCAQGGGSTATGAKASASWMSAYDGGYFRSGSQNEHCFTVLYELREPVKAKKGLFRDSPSPTANGTDALDKVVPPWGVLDDEGEEEQGMDIY